MTKRIMVLATAGMLALAGITTGLTTKNGCPLEGTVYCPKNNCPLAGTPDCPFDNSNTAMCCKVPAK